jgi:hypothetical protein
LIYNVFDTILKLSTFKRIFNMNPVARSVTPDRRPAPYEVPVKAEYLREKAGAAAIRALNSGEVNSAIAHTLVVARLENKYPQLAKKPIAAASHD